MKIGKVNGLRQVQRGNLGLQRPKHGSSIATPDFLDNVARLARLTNSYTMPDEIVRPPSLKRVL